jgi:hypothetical protein
MDYFRAVSIDEGIRLEWATTSEVNNNGFYILRSASANGVYEQIIFALSDSTQGEGVTYEYVDDTVTLGVVYFYKLEIIDLNGEWVFFGPISAGYGVSTSTPTVTLTGQAPARTSTLTATLMPSAQNTTNPYPIGTLPPQSTQGPYPISTTASAGSFPSITPSPTQPGSLGTPTEAFTPFSTTGTVNATKLPTALEVEATQDLLFPAPTRTQTPTVNPTTVPTAAGVALQIREDNPPGLTGRLKALLGIPIILWGSLAVFLVLFVKKALESTGASS